MKPLPLPLALADELYRHGSTKTPRTVADELARMHNEIEATDRQVEILTDELTKCSKAYGGLQAENAKLREALAVMLRDYTAVHDIGDVEMQPAIYQARAALARAGEKT